MTDNELTAYTDCMEAVAWYMTHDLNVIAEAYLARAANITREK